MSIDEEIAKQNESISKYLIQYSLMQKNEQRRSLCSSISLAYKELSELFLKKAQQEVDRSFKMISPAPPRFF
ncbi:MAG: hypothetical protein HQK63_00095 [Desulfamplus sp.]|nr:hypothetical protein [Desulfamplus sp.]